MVNESYSVTYLTDKSPTEVFTLLVNVSGWWSGIYGETIEGSSEKVGDEFSLRLATGYTIPGKSW
ncbi:hypothetical protein DYU05_02425 [Mucilaginibacter terrenus]|uniref:SRPBCC domain-containing protein n=1 Tax=Mucilaginibacter terrenus TaxID=2482727 RepID=A0A3E2NU05_9SPHI|nr:hypothetical protein DYU05_02425 [Mucilaginibacter terrenus]